MKNIFKICLLLSVFIIPQISYSSILTFLDEDDSKKEIKKEIKLEGDLQRRLKCYRVGIIIDTNSIQFSNKPNPNG